VVSLSTDDPPVLTALAPGSVTIKAGSASADVTVFAGTLPTGTLVWSNPGNGSGIYKIVPAIPSSSGVADDFAFQGDGTVAAITSDGTTAWTAAANSWQAIPDFQGGLIAWDGGSVWKLDGVTGQLSPAYQGTSYSNICSCGTSNGDFVVAHPDGTVLMVEDDSGQGGGATVVGIDPLTGNAKFRVPLDSSTVEGAVSGGSSVYSMIIAGDGYTYVGYTYHDDYLWYDPTPDVTHLMLMRIDTSGAYDKIKIKDWSVHQHEVDDVWDFPWNLFLITNADQGVLVTWFASLGTWDNPQFENGMAAVTGTSVSLVNGPRLPGQYEVLTPVLQAQDGSYIGTVQGDVNAMLAFDLSGNIRWSVDGYWQPRIATADNGVIATGGDAGSAVTFDQNGNATGQTSTLLVQSWTGRSYQYGSIDEFDVDPTPQATPPYWSSEQANRSGNSASPLCHDQRDQLIAEYGRDVILDASYKKPYPRFTPTCLT
jgi:hypothetical protein